MAKNKQGKLVNRNKLVRRKKINNQLNLVVNILFNQLYILLGSIGFWVSTVVGVWAGANLEVIKKFLASLQRSPLFKWIVGLLLAKIEKVPGMLMVTGYVLFNVRFKPALFMLIPYYYINYHLTSNLPVLDDVILGILFTLFCKTRNIKTRLILIASSLITIYLGLWGDALHKHLFNPDVKPESGESTKH